jgi:hypothetical protein
VARGPEEAEAHPALDVLDPGLDGGFEQRPSRLGFLEALQRTEQHVRNDDLLVSWAPDFAGETADQVDRVLADAGIDLDADPG